MKPACLMLCLLLAGASAARGDMPPRPRVDLSFDLLDAGPQIPARLSAENLQHSLHANKIKRQGKVRRGMLTAHQAFGLITLGALAATLVLGQLNYYDQYTSGDFTGRYARAHLGLGAVTTALFGATGVLALAAPNPYPKPVRPDTALLHKVSMALATAGMVTQIILGPVTASRVGRLDQPGLAVGHLATGYATFAFMATGVIAYFF